MTETPITVPISVMKHLFTVCNMKENFSCKSVKRKSNIACMVENGIKFKKMAG